MTEPAETTPIYNQLLREQEQHAPCPPPEDVTTEPDQPPDTPDWPPSSPA